METNKSDSEFSQHLTVSELITHLQTLPPNSRILEERAGEIRIVEKGDVRICEYTSGEMEDSSGDDISGKFITFSAWG